MIHEDMGRYNTRFAARNNRQGSTRLNRIYTAGTSEQVMKYVPSLLWRNHKPMPPALRKLCDGAKLIITASTDRRVGLDR
jgi:hypothetical protein